MAILAATALLTFGAAHATPGEAVSYDALDGNSAVGGATPPACAGSDAVYASVQDCALAFLVNQDTDPEILNGPHP